MSNSIKLLRIIIVFFIVAAVTLMTFVSPVYARGGCFVGDTQILTSEGYKSIAQINQQDQIITYNLITHQEEIGNISEIQVLISPDYFLINGEIKVTATHPFYVNNSDGITIKQTKNLQIGDRLLGYENSHPIVETIDYIHKSVTVYNLISINPNHNFYADGILVHNKGGGGGGGGGGNGGGRGSGNVIDGYLWRSLITRFPIVNIIAHIFDKVWGFGVIFIAIPICWYRYLNSEVDYSDIQFTKDEELIKFTLNLNENFTNKYSLRYSQDNEKWRMKAVESEVDENDYDNFIKKSELEQKFQKLFIQYQNDWMNKNFGCS